MTTMSTSSTVSSPPAGLLSQVVGNRRFLAAAGFLMFAIAGWYVLVWWLGFALDKKPVPWPAGVEVDKEFVMTSFPEMFPVIPPRYALLSSSRWNEHAIPEKAAIMYMAEDTRLVLGVGRSTDGPRRPDRASNWYLSRKYGDLRMLDPQHAGRLACPYWQLDVVYYTGEVDTVAHVPGRCMVAAGGKPLGNKVLTWRNLPENALGWTDIEVVRSLFHTTDPQGRQSTLVQYYTFSINGESEEDWKKVRVNLSWNIRQKYVYFGKIQFAPMIPLAGNGPEDIQAADEAAERFFRDAAVEILSTFPSARAVAELNRNSASK